MIKFLPNALLASSLLLNRASATPISTISNLTTSSEPPKANAPQVWVCQNYDWESPCRLIVFGARDQGQQSQWMSPAPAGRGPFDNSNYTIGSWGPSAGVYTYWQDTAGNVSSLMTFPGIPHVDDYWRDNIYLFAAFFHIDE